MKLFYLMAAIGVAFACFYLAQPQKVVPFGQKSVAIEKPAAEGAIPVTDSPRVIPQGEKTISEAVDADQLDLEATAQKIGEIDLEIEARGIPGRLQEGNMSEDEMKEVRRLFGIRNEYFKRRFELLLGDRR